MRGSLSICALITAATALFAADAFTWNWHKVERPTQTVSQVGLSKSEGVALNAALSAELGPPIPNFSAEEQPPDIRVKLLELNGDHIPEVIAQITGRFQSGATGNCPFLVFRKSGKAYESILVPEGINSYEGFTVTKQRTDGYLDLIFNQHAGSLTRLLRGHLELDWRRRRNRKRACYHQVPITVLVVIPRL